MALSMEEVTNYVNSHVDVFHQRRISGLESLKLSSLVSKNPYLFRVKNIQTAAELVEQLLQAFLSSSEEKQFGSLLEDLAIFIAHNVFGGHKSTAPGVDLEFLDKDKHYLVSVKSGPRWGNSSQQSQLARDLQNAVVRLKQSSHDITPVAVLGIAYGKTKTNYVRGYLKVCGQNFWYLISKDPDLYTKIIEPLGYKAKEHNEAFLIARARIANLLTKQFLDRFCDPNTGVIAWDRLVEANSRNFDLDTFL